MLVKEQKVLHSLRTYPGKIFLFFFVCGYIFIAGSCCIKPSQKRVEVKEFLSSLPLGERFLLDHFFRCLIQEDTIGYVLLGGKPMSFYSYIKPKYRNPFLFQEETAFSLMELDEKDTLFHKGWEIWEKYKSNFCGNNIFFDVVEQNLEFDFMKVIVINKRLMLPLFNSHLSKFKAIDSSLKDSNSLFQSLLHDLKFKQKFYLRPDLIGIFLGYGEKNAKLFQRMEVLYQALGYLGFTLHKPSADRLKTIKEELALIEKNFKTCTVNFVSKKHLFSLGVGFRADFSDPETSILKQKYTKYHRLLTTSYQGVNFLEKTLELISLANQL